MAKVRESAEHCRCMETARVLDLLLVDDGDGVRCAGVRASIAGRPVEIVADATVLATGGCGQVYRHTTNPTVATGDGFAIAHRAGARMADMEFVQFHPTALDTSENPLALICEAVRGEGATLLDAHAASASCRRGTSWPSSLRATSSRARSSVSSRRTASVHLDARQARRTSRPASRASSRSAARAASTRRTDLIPVTPAAHYMMGGIVTDLDGRTTVPGMYACGEVACTGVHGANRLASNSLLEGLVFAERVARDLIETPHGLLEPGAAQWAVPVARRPRGRAGGRRRDPPADVALRGHRPHRARAAHGGLAQLDAIEERASPGRDRGAEHGHHGAPDRAEAALLRKESRGGHFRSDFPKRVAMAGPQQRGAKLLHPTIYSLLVTRTR